ncbi:saccharopine dehydrogenase C-terminal domain-containing protein [Algoriphagus machipongonensis]|uniref:Saccharopine dehydrogenase n=1 Tax=Algoriphagus machipongonensis TaxID=388413 RepID=A3HXU2_9BACT|nr:saccharopine dehydrogenase C-terminal domain-containing protein [Algoriphagus machipongonensis]EAZ81415.1 saccharopine dehydrogenase [Algoriphagus machipongonensis]
MQTILILGGGKSSSYLIEYLAASCADKTRNLILADLDLNQAKAKLKGLPGTSARSLDIQNEQERKTLIQEADLVVSMLPAFMHPIVAKDCLELGKHFFSASYESAEMKKMKAEIESKGLFFLNECGLDPGIDHMSAMKIIDEARSKGEEILSFKSYCGGLLAPMSEDNPWKYKFTWNPRNVVLAGQGTAVYQEKGDLKIVPYHQVFKRIEPVSFDGIGDFEGYPNRDSLSYKKVYGLDSISTLLRGTLRRAGFSKAWDVFVQLGMTDDTINMELPENSSLRQFLNSFLPYHESLSIEEKLADFIPDLDFPTFEKIQWLGFFGTRKLPKSSGTAASILQSILEEDWALDSNDKDMIVMKHFFEIKGVNHTKSISSSLVCFGEDSLHTAMAKTVGLPLAIAVDLFLKKEIELKGLHIPVIPEIYVPILTKLEEQGIHFKETEKLSAN